MSTSVWLRLICHGLVILVYYIESMNYHELQINYYKLILQVLMFTTPLHSISLLVKIGVHLKSLCFLK